MRPILTRLAVVLLAASAFSSCDGASNPSASPSPARSPIAGANLCARLASVYAERTSLADAFRAAIANEMESARKQAAALRERLRRLEDGLPLAVVLAPENARLRDDIELAAQLLGSAADVLDPQAKPLDRTQALHDGETLLAVLDDVMATDEPGSTTARSCPDVRYVVDKVSFPPAPSGAAFGLPDKVGDWTLMLGVVDLNPDLAPVFESLGIEPSTVRHIRVDMFDGTSWSCFDVLDHVSVSADPLADVLPDDLLPRATARKTATAIAGFEVVRYEDQRDEGVDSTVATRADRAILFCSMPLELVNAILTAMP